MRGIKCTASVKPLLLLLVTLFLLSSQAAWFGGNGRKEQGDNFFDRLDKTFTASARVGEGLSKGESNPSVGDPRSWVGKQTDKVLGKDYPGPKERAEDIAGSAGEVAESLKGSAEVIPPKLNGKVLESQEADPRTWWGNFMDKLFGKDYLSPQAHVEQAAASAKCKAVEPVEHTTESITQQMKNRVSELKDTAKGVPAEASAQAAAALDTARGVAARAAEKAEEKLPIEDVCGGAKHVMESAGTAAGSQAAKAAEAGESLSESWRRTARAASEVPAEATLRAPESIEKAAGLAEKQAEGLKEWAAERTQEL